MPRPSPRFFCLTRASSFVEVAFPFLSGGFFFFLCWFTGFGCISSVVDVVSVFVVGGGGVVVVVIVGSAGNSALIPASAGEFATPLAAIPSSSPKQPQKKIKNQLCDRQFTQPVTKKRLKKLNRLPAPCPK